MTRILQRRARLGVAVLAVLLATAACTSSGGSEKASADSGTKSSADDASTPCGPEGDEKPSKALLRCGEQSIAFIETLYATGTGVAVQVDDEDYILTNLHVVDPFDSADVTLGGTEDLGRLPVVGVDVAADIALLGPIGDDGADVEPLPLGDPSPEKGDDVFLVGFPGTADVEEADLTITAGLVSRTREADGWDQTYLQTDAVIGEGQSGGALFGADGELLGISGLGYDPAFALVLQIQDVETAVDRILDGDGDEVIQVPQSAEVDGTPAEGGLTEGSVATTDDIETPTLFLPPSDEDRTWNLTVTGPEGRYGVEVDDALTGEPLAVSAANVALTDEFIREGAAASGVSPEVFTGGPIDPPSAEVMARETAPGVFSIEVPADQYAEVVLSVADDVVPADLAFTSDLPLWWLTEEVPVTTLELGTPAEGIVGGYRSGVPFRIDLEAGQEVELSASSPQGDVALAIASPGRTLTALDLSGGPADDALTWFEDSDEGLYGLDVLEPFTADVAGTYTLWMQNYDYTPLAYRVTVSEPSSDDAGDDATDETTTTAQKGKG